MLSYLTNKYLKEQRGFQNEGESLFTSVCVMSQVRTCMAHLSENCIRRIILMIEHC